MIMYQTQQVMTIRAKNSNFGIRQRPTFASELGLLRTAEKPEDDIISLIKGEIQQLHP